MRSSVSSVFMQFSTDLEGRVPWMYVDVKGLVTVGIGNLIDPRPAALALPFHHDVTGEPATQEEVAAAWDDLKANAAELGARGHKACERRNDLRLSPEAIDSLVLAKAAQNHEVLRGHFPAIDDVPADAQLGLHSMAWALGAAFAPRWPNFTAAVRAGDFRTAADQCHMSEDGNPGVVPRNVANALLFRNAATVVDGGGDPEALHWPSEASADGGGGDDGEPDEGLVEEELSPSGGGL